MSKFTIFKCDGNLELHAEFLLVMKRLFFSLILVISITACSGPEEYPLILGVASEPSAKTHNDQGIAHFKAGRYFEALIQFNQAMEANYKNGEIHFNLALCLHQEGKSDRAKKHFKLAKEFADGNPQILNSKLLNKYLDSK